MKKAGVLLTVFFLLGLISQFSYSQNRAIKFEEGPWKEIVAKAKTQNKLIFIDAYSTRCRPCKYLASRVFTNDSAADFYNDNFINAHFDMEKGEGLTIRSKYDVKAFPTLMFIDGNEQLVHKGVGAMGATALIKLGKNALNPEEQLITYNKKYDSGNRDPEFVVKYLKVLRDSYSDYHKVVDEYLLTIREDKLIDKNNWEIIKNYQHDINSREIKLLIKNKKQFAEAFSEKEVDNKIQTAFDNEFSKELQDNKFSKAVFDSLKNEVIMSGYDKANEVIIEEDFSYYAIMKDMEKFVPAARKYFEMPEVNPYKYDEAAWTVFENSDKKEDLLLASQWAKKGLEIIQKPAVYDTYANLQFKLGNKEEAIKYEEQALIIAKQNGDSGEELQKTLDKMKK